MQEQGKEQIYQKLIAYMESSKDFLLEQAPELVQQVLKYEKTLAYLSAGLMVVLLVTALSIGFYFFKHPSLDKYGSRDIASFLGVCIPSVLAPIFFCQLCCIADNLLKIHIAPKYFIIQLLMK